MFLLLVVTLDAQAEECWLPSPFASFPFTSPTVRFRVPSGSESTLREGGPFIVVVVVSCVHLCFTLYLCSQFGYVMNG